MTKDEALKMAIEYLECPAQGVQKLIVINACKEALEQQEQEPVAWMDKHYGNLHKVNYGNSIPLYTHPVKQLSDDEIWEIVNETHLGLSPFEDTMRFARAIEAKIRGE